MSALALVSTHPRPEVAAGEVLGETLERVGQTPSFVLVAAAGTHRSRLGELLGAVDDLLAPDSLAGVTTSRVQAGGERWRGGEGGAFGILAATSLPVGIRHLRFPSQGGVVGLPSLDGHDLVVFGDAASASLAAVAREVAAGAPDAVVVGGLLSAGPMEPAELWLGDRRLDHGALAVAVARPRLDGVAVQGLRRLGSTRTVTEVDGSIVVGLDGEPALDVLRRDLAALERPPRSAEALVLALDRHDPGRPGSSPVRLDHALDAALGGGLDGGVGGGLDGGTAALVGSPILGLESERRGLAIGGDAAGERRRLDWLQPGARVCFAEDAPSRVGVDLARRAPIGDLAVAFGDGDGLDALPAVADRFGAVLGLGAPIVIGPAPGPGGRSREPNGSARLAVAALAAD